MRQVLLSTLMLGEKETEAALRRRWTSTRHVQDMVELLAKLEAESTKGAA